MEKEEDRLWQLPSREGDIALLNHDSYGLPKFGQTFIVGFLKFAFHSLNPRLLFGNN